MATLTNKREISSDHNQKIRADSISFIYYNIPTHIIKIKCLINKKNGKNL